MSDPTSKTTDDRQKEIEAWSKALARAEDLAIERKKEIQRLREIKILDSDQYDVSDKMTDLQNERDWALADVERLRGVLAEISAARTDSCLVHELVQQALGFDPDLEIKP